METKSLNLSGDKFFIFLRGNRVSCVSHSHFQGGWGPSSPAPVADPPPPSPNLPAEPLSAVPCIQNDMPVVPKKPSAWWSLGPHGDTPGHTYMHVFKWWPQAGWVKATWSSAFPILKTNTVISTATCMHEEVLMASREKNGMLFTSVRAQVFAALTLSLAAQPRAGLCALHHRAAQGSSGFCHPHFTPQNEGSKPQRTKASQSSMAPGLPDTWH